VKNADDKKKTGFLRIFRNGSVLRAKNDVPLILGLYAVSLFITVFMYRCNGPTLYIFALIACAGYVAVCILIAYKLIAHFKHDKK
jgi:hypothetical protein